MFLMTANTDFLQSPNSYQVVELSDIDAAKSYFRDVSDSYVPQTVESRVYAAMNFRNSYTPDEQTIPQEFLFQPADGHLWYTEEMLLDRTVLWDEVVKLTWGKDGKNQLIKPRK